jgi:hypothetical protein
VDRDAAEQSVGGAVYAVLASCDRPLIPTMEIQMAASFQGNSIKTVEVHLASRPKVEGEMVDDLGPAGLGC